MPGPGRARGSVGSPRRQPSAARDAGGQARAAARSVCHQGAQGDAQLAWRRQPRQRAGLRPLTAHGQRLVLHYRTIKGMFRVLKDKGIR